MLNLTKPKVAGDMQMMRDQKILLKFIACYCQAKHADAPQEVVDTQVAGEKPLTDEPVVLCPECAKLLKHALVKRAHCRQNPKPQCKHCPIQCYHPVYQEQIRKVMKFSGIRMVTRGRLDYLLHLLF